MLELSPVQQTLLGGLLLIAAFLLWFCKTSFSYWKSRGLDSPSVTIPFGNALDLYLGKVTFGELFSNLYLEIKKTGLRHAGTYFFWKPVYIPVDPELIKKILISDAGNFPNHGLYISEKNDPLSGHIFNMEDDKWRTLRAKMPNAFTSAKMKKMFVIMEQMTKPLTEILDKYAESGDVIDIKKELSSFTTDVISACAFGLETKTMKNENPDLLKHGRKFFDYQWNIYKNTMVMVVPRAILKRIKFRITDKDAENYFMNMFKNIFDYRKGKVSRNDLADTLVRLTQKNENELDYSGKHAMEPLNFEEFSAQMYVFFSAGFETSSSTQTFALFELAKDKQSQDKLREEVLRILFKYDNKLTYEALMEMQYLDKVINETLRLYPVFPILPRVCRNDYKVPDSEFIIEKNTLVMVSNMGIQRDPEYWPEPAKFDPERFSNENKSKRPFVAHLPFGEGPRICVGKRFGLLQTKVGLITILKNYEVCLNEKTNASFKFAPWELILRKTGDIWINLKKISA